MFAHIRSSFYVILSVPYRATQSKQERKQSKQQIAQREQRMKQETSSKILAQTLEISGATLRNYVREFGEYLSDKARRSKQRRYTSQDIEILTRASKLLSEGYTYQDTREILAGQEAYTGEVVEDDEEINNQGDEQPIRGEIQPATFFKELIDSLTTRHEGEISYYKRQLAYWQLPWYKRLFREPPGE